MHNLKYRLFQITLCFDCRNASFGAPELYKYFCSNPPLDWRVIECKVGDACLSSELNASGVKGEHTVLSFFLVCAN